MRANLSLQGYACINSNRRKWLKIVWSWTQVKAEHMLNVYNACSGSVTRHISTNGMQQRA